MHAAVAGRSLNKVKLDDDNDDAAGGGGGSPDPDPSNAGPSGDEPTPGSGRSMGRRWHTTGEADVSAAAEHVNSFLEAQPELKEALEVLKNARDGGGGSGGDSSGASAGNGGTTADKWRRAGAASLSRTTSGSKSGGSFFASARHARPRRK